MIGVGRRGLNEAFNRVCGLQSLPAFASQNVTSLLSAGAFTHQSMPVALCHPASQPAPKCFATESNGKYDHQGEMSAVTFHGPRTMKVSKKPKPRLETPGVHIMQPPCA